MDATLAALFFVVGVPALIAAGLFMAFVQPLWAVVDCALDNRRGTTGKVIWIILLVLVWGVASFFYGLFAASGRWLRRLTLASLLAVIGVAVLGGVLAARNADFKLQIEREWNQRKPEILVQAARPARYDARSLM